MGGAGHYRAFKIGEITVDANGYGTASGLVIDKPGRTGITRSRTGPPWSQPSASPATIRHAEPGNRHVNQSRCRGLTETPGQARHSAHPRSTFLSSCSPTQPALSVAPGDFSAIAGPYGV